MKKWITILMALCLAFPAWGMGEAGAISPEEMLRSMTTEQKVAQVLMPAFYYRQNEKGERIGVAEIYPEMEEMLKKYSFGGLIFNLQNAQENDSAVRLVDAAQAANASVSGRPQLITCTDQEGGYVTRLGKGTQTPGNMALGAINDPEVTKQVGRLIGEEVTAIGYSGTFGPVVDVNNNPANPVIGIRSFSDDPQMTATHGVAMLNGLHEAGALATLKHFPGHGDTDTDSHTGMPCVNKTYEELKAFELVPFQACIDAGADMVMTAHIVYPQVESGTYVSVATGEEIGLPATLSKTILTDILRGDMGFGGLIVTDAMNMDAVARHFSVLDAAKLALEAGVDLILRPVDTDTPEGLAALEKYIQDVAALADGGELPMEALDAAALRVLTFKEKHGMLTPYESGDVEARVREAVSVVGSAAHHEEEFEIAKKAITLVKNENILPLNTEETIAIVVPYASQIKSAEYAVRRLKEEGRLKEETEIPVVHLSAITVENLTNLCKKTRHILAVNTTYSVDDLNPNRTSGSVLLDTVITLAHAAGNDVTVVSAHLPYDVARFPSADAIIVAYNARGMSENPLDAAGSVSQYGPGVPAALYMLLSGEKMTGKLPINIPSLDADYRFTDEILYARGTGE